VKVILKARGDLGTILAQSRQNMMAVLIGHLPSSGSCIVVLPCNMVKGSTELEGGNPCYLSRG
jgi:hypothetical protein